MRKVLEPILTQEYIYSESIFNYSLSFHIITDDFTKPVSDSQFSA